MMNLSWFATLRRSGRPAKPLRSVGKRWGSQLRHHPVGLRPAVAEELPDVPHLADQVQVQVGDHDVIAVALADREHLPARVAEVALAVELADPPRLLEPRPVDRPDEV